MSWAGKIVQCIKTLATKPDIWDLDGRRKELTPVSVLWPPHTHSGTYK